MNLELFVTPGTAPAVGVKGTVFSALELAAGSAVAIAAARPISAGSAENGRGPARFQPFKGRMAGSPGVRISVRLFAKTLDPLLRRTDTHGGSAPSSCTLEPLDGRPLVIILIRGILLVNALKDFGMLACETQVVLWR